MKSKDRSVLIIHQKSHIGGGQTYVSELFKEFNKRGYTSEILENTSTIGIIKKLISSKQKYIIWNVYYEFSLLPFILSVLIGKKNAIVIYGIWALESRSIFTDSQETGRLFDQGNFEQKLYLKQFLFIAFSSYVIHLSKYAKRLFDSVALFKLFRNKKHIIIYGGADNKLFNKPSQKEKSVIRDDLGIAKDCIVLMMAGRIEKRKNYQSGLQILKQVKKLTAKKVLLYIVLSSGEFNEYRHLTELFKQIHKLGMGEYVRIVTGITQDKLARFYKAADVYLMLSEELETFGLVTLEAIMSGLPVFGFRACATPEIVSNRKNKFLFTKGDAINISKAIAGYLKKSATQKDKLVYDLNLYASKFSWGNSATKIIEAFWVK